MEEATWTLGLFFSNYLKYGFDQKDQDFATLVS